MKTKLLHEQQGEKTLVLIFDTGDEVVSRLLDFAKNIISIVATSRLSVPSAMSSWAISTEKKTAQFIAVCRSVTTHKHVRSPHPGSTRFTTPGDSQALSQNCFSRQNPKIVYWKIKDLRVQTFLFSVICDRADLPACVTQKTPAKWQSDP